MMKSPSMRRPVGVKSILFSFGEATFVLPPSGRCRHASIRTLEERFVSLGACWGFSFQPVLPSVWRPCGSALAESNLGQAINAVTGTRLWAFDFSLPGTVLTFVLSFCSTQLPPLSFGCCCAMVGTPLRSPTSDAAAPPAFLRWRRWLASSRICALSTSITWERTASRPETGLLIPSVTGLNALQPPSSARTITRTSEFLSVSQNA
jgi:hypothetical protein